MLKVAIAEATGGSTSSPSKIGPLIQYASAEVIRTAMSSFCDVVPDHPSSGKKKQSQLLHDAVGKKRCSSSLLDAARTLSSVSRGDHREPILS